MIPQIALIDEKILNQNRWIPWFLEGSKKIPAVEWQDFNNRKPFSRIKGNVGIVFDKSIDLLVGLDLDDCIDENGNYNEQALKALELFKGKAYIEKSVRKKGLHFIFYADLGISFNAKPIEYYESGRYFTFSGLVSPESTPTPQYCQEEITSFIKEFAPKQLSPRKKGELGEIGLISTSDAKKALSHIDPDCSRGEWLSIACALHYEFEGEDVGFDLFHEWSKKALEQYESETECRELWDSLGNYPGDPITIGTLISKAIDSGYSPTTEVKELMDKYNSKTNPWLNRVAEISPHLTPPTWLIDGMLADKMTMIAGSPAVGKTSCLVPLALTVAGFQAIDSDITCKYPRKVIYVTEDKWQIDLIIHGILKHMELKNGQKPKLKDIAERFIVVNAMKSNPKELVRLVEIAVNYATELTTPIGTVEVNPLIVFDTASSTFLMDDENNNSEASKFVSAIKENFINKSFPVWVVAHTAKAKKRSEVKELSVRGAGAFEGDANCVAYLVEEDGVKERFLVLGKRRYGAKFSEIVISSTVHNEIVADVYGEAEDIIYRYSTIRQSSEIERQIAKEEAAIIQKEERSDLYKNRILEKLKELGETTPTELARKTQGKMESNSLLITQLIEEGSIMKTSISTRGFKVKLP